MREVKLRPPPFPDKLPFEDVIDTVLNRIAANIDRSPLVQKLEKLRSKFPEIASMEMPTPLGMVRTPRLALPNFTPPIIDERRRKIIKAAIGTDLASLIEMIPFVGAAAAPLADAINDTYYPRIRDMLTDKEWTAFKSVDEVSPATALSALITFSRVREG